MEDPKSAHSPGSRPLVRAWHRISAHDAVVHRAAGVSQQPSKCCCTPGLPLLCAHHRFGVCTRAASNQRALALCTHHAMARSVLTACKRQAVWTFGTTGAVPPARHHQPSGHGAIGGALHRGHLRAEVWPLAAPQRLQCVGACIDRWASGSQGLLHAGLRVQQLV